MAVSSGLETDAGGRRGPRRPPRGGHDRRERSAVRVRSGDDPVKQALHDAKALARTHDLPGDVVARVLPGLYRTALEAALLEPARRRLLGAGLPHAEIEQRIAKARGWTHFTYRHDIKKCSILDAALKDKADRNDGHGRLEYDGVAVKAGGKPAEVKFTVIVQYTRKTEDGRYDAGEGQETGVANAFCHNQPNNKCPAWMNQ
ncbi:hypothetical protein ACFYNZ_01545 [Streptomyces kebangsaanensis]|uniref:Transposase n=1 Tax=Streptomyces kebangsaanensis TaxID=864058 RepID=A0ABW6KJZ5_9ACTN